MQTLKNHIAVVLIESAVFAAVTSSIALIIIAAGL